MRAGLGREDIRALLDDLSVKLFAARAEIDADDIILLYRQLGFTTVDEGLDLVEQAYPGRPVPAKVKFLLTEIVDSLQD
jgi:hypothetical protein